MAAIHERPKPVRAELHAARRAVLLPTENQGGGRHQVHRRVFRRLRQWNLSGIKQFVGIKMILPFGRHSRV